jgi:hypothetical protein
LAQIKEEESTMAKDRHTIYGRLIELASPFRFAAPADRLELDDDLRCSLPPGDELRRVLEDEFDSDELHEAGVLVELDLGVVELHLGLTDGGPLVALRDDSGAIFDVVTPLGCLSGEVPLFQMLRDNRTRALADAHEGTIFAADALTDVALLRSLGLAAVPMMGLGELDYAGLRKLDAAFGGGPVGCEGEGPVTLPPECYESAPGNLLENSNQRLIPRSLTLLTHSLVRPSLEIADGFRTVASHLARFQKHADANDWQVAVQWPTDDELEEFYYFIKIVALDKARAWFFGDEDLADLDIFIDPTKKPTRSRPVADVPGALARLREVRAKRQRQFADESQCEKALDEYEQAVDRDLITSLVDQAMETSCPVAQNQGVILSGVFRAIHNQWPTIEKELAKLRRTKDPQEVQRVLATNMNEMRKNIASAQSLAKSYKANRQEAVRRHSAKQPPEDADPLSRFADSMRRKWPR